MNNITSTLHLCLRLIHIIMGFAGLSLFWLIMAAPKGSPFHVRCGKLFAGVTWIIGGSAVISSIWALVHLDSFVSIPWDTADREGTREIYRFIFAILLYLAVATLSGAVFGIEVVRKRKRHEELRLTSLPAWLIASASCAGGLMVFGIWGLTMKASLAGGMPWASYFIPLVVGVVGLRSIRSDWRWVFGASPSNRAWQYQHVWRMCGTGVAFHTAFLVFGANRMLGFRLPGAWALIPWIAPPVIGMSLTAWYVRRMRRPSVTLQPATVGS